MECGLDNDEGKTITKISKWKYVRWYVNNNGILYGVMDHEWTEYSIHVLAKVVDGENRN